MEAGAQAARARALAVLRVRSTALAAALLPAAVAVVLAVGVLTGRLAGGAWSTATVLVGVLAFVVLLPALVFAAVVARARPAMSPTVPLTETSAPDLYRLVRDLADRLEVPAPSAIALTPDCDSWLEDRSHPAHRRAARRSTGGSGAPRPAGSRPPQPLVGGPAGGSGEAAEPVAPVLVIGSPFLWWMRVAELRAVLAPVVAGTGPSVHPDIAAARRFVRGLDAAAAIVDRSSAGRVRTVALGWIAALARLLLERCRTHVAEMERAVAAAASERAQSVDYGLRIVAQEQVGLAYAGWDRLLTRVALPAWRMGRWPSRLDAGVVSALTELSRRDRLAEGFTSRLGERPACDLLEQPGAVDEAASLLAARLFHGGPTEPGPQWSPVDWQQYPEEVVDRKWRLEAARLLRALDAIAPPEPPLPLIAAPAAEPDLGPRPVPPVEDGAPVADRHGGDAARPVPSAAGPGGQGPTLARVMTYLEGGCTDTLAARISAETARDEAVSPAPGAPGEMGASDGGGVPLFPLQPPRTGRDLLADHVTAMVCCAAVDTAGAAPGLDWLDGPALLVGGERRTDLGTRVLTLVEDGDPEPLQSWLSSLGVRPEKPVRLV
ncbi:hypothetical protein [Streptomyces sp. NPDC006879]|uniref:hypothetical protein n=1 Tax=Streptomyces sp. NPDC006879 TaxID=3364767 RepID=UPI0036C713AA